MTGQTEPRASGYGPPRQRALLAAIDTGEYDPETSLDELTELARSAGAEVAGRMIQKRDAPDAATCIGAGRLEEAAAFIRDNQVELMIFDLELSKSQLANIEEAVGVRVVDRTMLILDIFAQRAKSSEGRLQVELAQQRYLLPRLRGQGSELSRLGGGIGTRGPGETKLESDRRHIRRRIAALERELEEVGRRRALVRGRRQKNEAPAIAIVGYTNVGKSTLLNRLTAAGVLAEDMLFATLDPTARALALPDGRTAVLIDTVGLVRRLPHHLVEAFRSTLEEAAQADLIWNVCDASAPDMEEQLAVTRELLAGLGAEGVPVLDVLNKCDRLALPPFLPGGGGIAPVAISAKTGYGLDALLSATAKALRAAHTRLTLLIPYSEGGLAAEIRARGRVFSEEFCEKGVLLDALVDNRLLHRARKFLAAAEK